MKKLPLITGSSGLNTRVDAARVSYDHKSGVSDLVLSVNVKHDISGMPCRRDGQSLLEGGDFHSLFSGGGECYVAEETYLYRVNLDFTLSGVRDSLVGNWISYAVTPLGIFYTNGFDLGRLNDGASYAWGKGVYVGKPTSRQFFGPPVGKYVELFDAFMLIARGNTLYWSQPYAYGLYDLARDYLTFPSDLKMVKAVAGGVYVSDSKRMYFLAGNNPAEWSLKKKAYDCPALEWSDESELVPGERFGLDGEDILCAVWVNTDGPCYGTHDGQVKSLNDNKVVYPAGLQHGAGIMVGYNFIHAMT